MSVDVCRCILVQLRFFRYINSCVHEAFIFPKVSVIPWMPNTLGTGWLLFLFASFCQHPLYFNARFFFNEIRCHFSSRYLQFPMYVLTVTVLKAASINSDRKSELYSQQPTQFRTLCPVYSLLTTLLESNLNSGSLTGANRFHPRLVHKAKPAE